MARSNHLVIDGFSLGSNVTMKASVAAYGQIIQIAHAELRFLVGGSLLPIFDCVRSEPTGRWAMAIFAAHSVADVEGLRAHLGRDGQRMAGQTFLILVGRRI
jgi:hypothetical protein